MATSEQKKTILVVDDTPENLDILRGVLTPKYKVQFALNGAKAMSIAQATSKPDLILLDIMMPEIDGYEVIKQLKADPTTAKIPVIFITALGATEDETHGLELGAVDFITKPITPAIVLSRVRTQLALYNQAQELEEMVDQRTKQLAHTQKEIIRRLGRAAEFKDNETGLHVIRMGHYSKILALALGFSSQDADLILNAAPMHDIGKIGIPDHVLLKPGKLDQDEWAQMQKHPAIGAEIIGEHDNPLLKLAKNLAETHHEKWDGSGYPAGLKGEEIGLESRIVAVADVFDALTTERPYKQAWTVEKAADLIQFESGKHFDPRVIEVFTQALPEFLKIKEKYSEEM